MSWGVFGCGIDWGVWLVVFDQTLCGQNVRARSHFYQRGTQEQGCW